MFNKIVLIAVFVLSIIASCFLSKFFTADVIIGYMNCIRDQGLAIYAIFGVWITIIYPECLASLKGQGKSKPVSEFNGNLIYPLVFGTITLIIALVFRMIQPIITSQIKTLINYKELLRGVAAFVIIWCYSMQILSFLCSLVIVYDIKRTYGFSKAVTDARNSLPQEYKES